MNLHNIVDHIEKIDTDVYDRPDDRRSAVKNLVNVGGKLALATVPIALGSLLQKSYGQGVPPQIIDVLNFALTLEYLEAEFYNIGLSTHNLIPAGDDRMAFEVIAEHENAHVELLMQAIKMLGGTPVAKPTFDFSAGNGSGTGPFNGVFRNYDLFLAVSQTFEDTGVRAYKGQAGNLMGINAVLRTALQIHSVEARHASHVREIRSRRPSSLVVGMPQPWITLNQSNIASPAVQPSYNGEENTMQAGVQITGINGFAITSEDASESFDEPLTKAQVLAIVDPFIV
ncbi:MAG: ferritin-like domain-containing protein [Chitinophagaceae bacterium]